ncbi:MAG: TonB-dependent receptor, partial [Gammaproteobacteria bacterium]|nr:TonB-dependent receptor [Gammaproteobacteria bacterium]
MAAILGAHAAQATFAAEAAATGGGAELQEVIVTANRRAENLQDVPIAIQALTGETLSQLNVATFDDYVKFLPNVSVSSNGPGQGQIYMRGLATTQDGSQSSGATGSFPNVAVYLDEQSAQLPGRNLDIYAADIERVEVLEGPQGTLFGAGAQAGVIRYITNKPKLNKTEANFDASYATTAHGRNSNSFTGVLNLGVIPDTLAVRAVIYNDSRGGYIDNVPGHFTRNPTDVGIAYYFCPQTGGTPPTAGYAPYLNGPGTCIGGDGRTILSPGVVPKSPTINNDNLVGRAINPALYKGIRVSALYQFTSAWDLLLTESYQDIHTDGVFAEMPYGPSGETLPDLSVVQFNPSWNDDRFTNTAWTLDGRLDWLKVVYTGGYLVRNVEQVQDYTNYARGKYADYYQCRLPGSPFAGYNAALGGYQKVNPGDPGECFSPSATFHVLQRNTHQNHELRFSTPDDWRARGILGFFYEDFLVQDQSDWLYKTTPDGIYGTSFNPLQAPAGSSANNHNVRAENVAFYDDVQRGYKQKAAFTSVDLDLVPKVLTLTGGVRYYRMDTFEIGAKAGSFGCRPGGIYSAAQVANPCPLATNLDTIPVPPGNEAYSDTPNGLHKLYKGFKGRANLSWHVTPDHLLYYTWSQGFRPGGFNRGSGFVGGSSPLAGVFLVPIGFAPDVLTNNEAGWKTMWLNHRLQWNGAVYKEDWKNVQIGIFDPGVTGNLTFTTNGPNYRVKGVETELIARVTPQLTLQGSASWNSSELTNSPTLIDKHGNPITIANPYGAQGSPLAQSPPIQMNLRIRYEWDFDNYSCFAQIAGTHQGHSYATTDRLSHELSTTPGQQGISIAYDQPAFSTLDASLGIGRDAWTVQLYGVNLTD